MFDALVVGRSLSGCLCALELRARGLSVALFDYHSDSEHFQRMARIPSTLVNDEPVSGKELDERLRRRFQEIGVVEGHDWACEIEAHEGNWRVKLFGHEDSVLARRLVFAPAGRELGAPDLSARDFYGRGVSTDAWSDLTFATLDEQSGNVRLFFAGATVAVLGSGLRAAEESLLCVHAGVAKVIMLCEQTMPDFGALSEDIRRCQNIEVRSRSRIVALQRDSSGQLAAIRCVDATGCESVIAPQWLFVARGVECDWSALRDHRDLPGLVVAGIAAGISYADYSALIADAHRAAKVVTSDCD